MIRVLLVDDIRTVDVAGGRLWANRHTRPIFVKTCRTYDEGLEAIKNDGPWDVLLLDHDLADLNIPERTGYTLLCYLEENLDKLPATIEIVSANPVGRQKMSALIRRLYDQKEKEDSKG